MKILFVCNFEAPYRIDFWNELSNYCELTILFTETIEQQMKAEKRDAGWFKRKDYKFKYKLLKQINILGISICFDVIKYIDSKFDIIIFHPYSPPTCIYGIQHCIIHKIPYMINSDGGFKKSGKGFNEKLKRYLISHAEGVLSTGDKTDEYLEFYGAKKERLYRYTLTSLRNNEIRTVPYSMNEKEHYRNKLGIQEKKVILSVGRVIPIKGYETLIEASKFLDDTYGIYIVGGQETRELRNLRERLNIQNVHFIEFIAHDEIYKYYAAADIFVMATRGDVWGLVINEALANGLPVVSTRMCIAATELIKDGYNGWFFNVGDSEELTKILNMYFEHNDEQKMSLNALRSIKEITIENMAKRHEAIFLEVISKR